MYAGGSSRTGRSTRCTTSPPPVHAAPVRGDARPRRLEGRSASIPGAPPRLDAPLDRLPVPAALRPGHRGCETVDPEVRPLGRASRGGLPPCRAGRADRRVRARERAARGRGSHVRYPIPRGIVGSVARAEKAVVRRRRRVVLARGGRAPRRWSASRAAARRRRRTRRCGCRTCTGLDPLRRDGHHAPAHARAAAAAPADADDLAGPVRVARPALPGEAIVEEPLLIHRVGGSKAEATGASSRP